MHHRAKYATEMCRQMIPYSVVIFSLLLQHRFHNNFTDQRKAFKVCRKVNSSIELAFQNGLHTISHPHIIPNEPTFHWDTLHLSDYGYSMFLNTLMPCAIFSVIIHIYVFNWWQLAKMKKSIPTCPCHEIYRDEAVGLKSCKNT